MFENCCGQGGGFPTMDYKKAYEKMEKENEEIRKINAELRSENQSLKDAFIKIILKL